MTQPENTLPVTFGGLKALREFLKNYDGSWRALAWEFNGKVSISTLRRIVDDGYKPKRPETLRALHLPLTGEGRVCPIHHIVHDRLCSAERKPRATRHNWKSIALTLAGLWASGHIQVRR